MSEGRETRKIEIEIRGEERESLTNTCSLTHLPTHPHPNTHTGMEVSANYSVLASKITNGFALIKKDMADSTRDIMREMRTVGDEVMDGERGDDGDYDMIVSHLRKILVALLTDTAPNILNHHPILSGVLAVKDLVLNLESKIDQLNSSQLDSAIVLRQVALDINTNNAELKADLASLHTQLSEQFKGLESGPSSRSAEDLREAIQSAVQGALQTVSSSNMNTAAKAVRSWTADSSAIDGQFLCDIFCHSLFLSNSFSLSHNHSHS